MKEIILLITLTAIRALTTLASAAETLSIKPAHTLPDYTKLSLATNTVSGFTQFWDTLASGDFNEDGLLDAVVLVGGPDDDPWPLGLMVLLQGADGTFAKKIEYTLPTTGFTWDFVLADFNEDGHLDLVLDELGTDLVMLLGNGDGTFHQPAYVGLAASTFPVAADLDGDHHLDLLVGKLDGTVGFFAGVGNGTFTLKASLDTQVNANPPYYRQGQIMVGDLNRDGKLDVAVASVTNLTTEIGNLDVFLGKGGGSFQEVIRTSSVAVWRGALGDFNGDGILDFAGDTRLSSPRIEIWLGQGDGRFTKGKTYSIPSGYAPLVVQVADLNQDGILDVVVSAGNPGVFPATLLSIFLGNGDGSFQSRREFTTLAGSLVANVGPRLIDFNKDGLLDLLTVAEFRTPRANALALALNQGVKFGLDLGFLVNVQSTTPGATGPVLLEASTNLRDWTPLATNSPAATWPFVDTSAGLQQRFYRTRQP